MNQNRLITAFIIIIFGGGLAIKIVADVVGGNSNNLAKLFQWMFIFSPLLGFVAPRPAVFVLILCGGYIDQLKRLMALAPSSFGAIDLIFVLAIPAGIMVGICASLLVKKGLGANQDPRDTKIFVGGIILTTIACGMSFLASGGAGSSIIARIQNVVNIGSYTVMVFVIPMLFSDRRELLKLFKWIVIVLIPVALIGLRQRFYGFSDNDVAYLNSGLTMQADQLARIYAGLEPRIFSTLASPGALSSTMSCAAVLALIPLFVPVKKMGIKMWPKWIGVLLFVLFVIAGVLSLKRIPTVIWFTAIPLVFLFRHKFTTLITYAGGATALLLMIIFAPLLTSKLGLIDEAIGLDKVDSEYGMAFRVGTYAVRLRSLELFHDPETYSLFGIAKEDRTSAQLESHTLLSTIVLGLGVVPVLLIGLFSVICLWKVHMRILQARDIAWKRVMILCVSLILGLVASSALGSNALPVFPVNLILWMSVGGMVLLFRKDPPDLEEIHPHVESQLLRRRPGRMEPGISRNPIANR